MPRGPGLTVHTEEGDVKGSLVSQTVRQFLGVPYATANRWGAPQPALRRNKTFDAFQFGTSCPQALDPVTLKYIELTGQRGENLQESEDSLTVNIWAPSIGRKLNTAVLIWFHGGGFASGSANLDMYRGENMVRDNDDIILVTVNYRLNVLGQPNSPQLVEKTHSQNFGLLDIEHSIKWVYANISNFGGDPDRITIVGQSAGGVAVDLYAFAHPEDTIVKGIISQSGTASGDVPALDAEINVKKWNKVAEAVGCGNTATDDEQLNRMKKVPAKTLVDAVVKTRVHFNHIIDENTVFPDMQKRVEEGKFLRVPLLVGTTQHDFDVITVSEQLAVQDDTIPVITQMHADAITQAALTYPAGVAATIRSKFGVPCWRYQYQAVYPNLTSHHDLRCYHGSEMPMIFGTYDTTFKDKPSTPSQAALSKYMQSAWVAFAKDPRNGLKEFGWPMYNPDTNSLVQLGNSENPTGATFSSGKLLDSSCINKKDTLLTVAGMLAPLLPLYNL